MSDRICEATATLRDDATDSWVAGRCILPFGHGGAGHDYEIDRGALDLGIVRTPADGENALAIFAEQFVATLECEHPALTMTNRCALCGVDPEPAPETTVTVLCCSQCWHGDHQVVRIPEDCTTRPAGSGTETVCPAGHVVWFVADCGSLELGIMPPAAVLGVADVDGSVL